MFDYKIDITLLPAMWITWASTKGGKFNERHWLNCKTGKKKTAPEKWMYYPDENQFDKYTYSTEGHIGVAWNNRNDDKMWVRSGAAVRFAYVKYHKREDVLEVAVVGIDTTRKIEPHPWKYLGDRYFIRRDKTIVNQNGLTCSSYYMYEGHTAWNPNIMFSMLCRLIYNNHAVDEFKKFIGQDFFTIGNGRGIDITGLWDLQEWYKTKQRGVIKGSAQQMVDSLVELPLSDITDKISSHTIGRWCKAAYFERVNDEWSVIRIFSPYGTEMNRMYISDDGKNRFATYDHKDWIVCNTPQYKYNDISFINSEDGINNCKRIKYAMEAIDNIDDKYRVNCLFAVLRMPELEQLAKLDCKDSIKRIVMQTYHKAELKHWAGDYYNEKEKNILRKIGLNRNQLSCYAKQTTESGYYYSYCERALTDMRKMFGNDLSHLDITTFERYLKGLYKIRSNIWRDLRDQAVYFRFEYDKFVKNLIRLGDKNDQVYRLVNDTMSQARSLNAGTCPTINWYFDDYSDLVRAHDALVALKNAQDAERRAYYELSVQERQKKDEEKRKKIDKERKQYEYEDDLYIIRLPKDSTEIVDEGTKQHICIGAYTSRHAEGHTNLFFLRAKSNPDKPFYAIEMNNHKTIVQIHGFGNSWLGNHPDAIPTVIRWLRKNGISCSDQILTCTAKGYGRVNSYVPMPIVD